MTDIHVPDEVVEEASLAFHGYQCERCSQKMRAALTAALAAWVECGEAKPVWRSHAWSGWIDAQPDDPGITEYAFIIRTEAT